MRHELIIGGVLISPFVAYLGATFVVLMGLRVMFRWMRFSRYVANPPLAEAGIFICVLALLILLL